MGGEMLKTWMDECGRTSQDRLKDGRGEQASLSAEQTAAAPPPPLTLLEIM
eukprot:SAG22_NODE_312_length_12614_cov_4.783540_7_plen_51_part_00